MVVAAAMLIMAGCERWPVLAHAHFLHLPSAEWLKTQRLNFYPVYDDSTAAYDLSLALRHDNTYRYRNLSLVADVMAADSTTTCHKVDITLADEYGNWSGGGFGALYQYRVTIVSGVSPAAARRVVLRQAMAGCDTLCGVVDVGIIAKPH